MSTRELLDELRQEVQWATAGHRRRLDEARDMIKPLLRRLGELTREHLSSLLAGADHEASTLETMCQNLTSQANEIVSSRHIDAGRAAIVREQLEQFLIAHQIRRDNDDSEPEPFGLWRSYARAAAARLETIDSDLQTLLARHIGLQFILVRYPSSPNADSYQQMLQALELELATARSLYAACKTAADRPPGDVAEALHRAEAIADGLGRLLLQACENSQVPIVDLSARLATVSSRLRRLAVLCTRYPRTVCRHGVSPWQWSKLKQLRAIVAEVPHAETNPCDIRVQRAQQLLAEIEAYCLQAETRRDLRHLQLITREVRSQLHLDRLTAATSSLQLSLGQLELAENHAETAMDQLLILTQLTAEVDKARSDFNFDKAFQATGAATRACRKLELEVQRLQRLEEQLRLDHELSKIADAEDSSRLAIRLASCQSLGIELMMHPDISEKELVEVSLLLADIKRAVSRDELLRIEDRLLMLARRIKTTTPSLPDDDFDRALRGLIEAERAPVGAPS